jgi:hypothetical protein
LALADLANIEASDGRRAMLALFQWCERLDEASTRAEAERMRSREERFRLRVADYNIVFELTETPGADLVEIHRIRRWRGAV